MSAGTLALTNKSDAVKGTGTTFTAMKAGDFIVVSIGGTPYTLTVKSITSDTQLTLISNFTGPTQSGLAWYEVPREAQSLITAALATQTTEALRGQNLDKDNWQQVFSVSDDITVTLKDGSQFTGPSWLKIVDLLKTVDLEQVQEIADQIRQSQNAVAADKAAVATDRGVVETKASEAAASAQAAAQHEQSASGSASTASQKATDATAEADRAEQAADDAETRGAAQVSLATTQADRAKEEADRAAASNPANALIKSENLNDLENKATAVQNLLDGKPLPLASPAVADTDAATLGQVKSRNEFDTQVKSTVNASLLPPEGTEADGGRFISLYQINGVDECTFSMRAIAKVGGSYLCRMSLQNNRSGKLAIFDFDENGTSFSGGSKVLTVANSGWGVIAGPEGLQAKNQADLVAGMYYANGSDIGSPGGTGGYGLVQLTGNFPSYRCQLAAQDGGGGRLFIRAYSGTSFSGWSELQKVSPSDERLKNLGEKLDLQDSLSNVERMEFINFTFKQDEKKSPRRGVTSQQIEEIDPEYIRDVGGMKHLDTTPMLLDALASIKYLSSQVKELKKEIETLKSS
ncbi:tail fiber domain-containing protein [Siccibacter colletis]|uniref:tail fiber domain-containing protein n=1 Tax=Siccibacter colletis TaxID=1505757 RepID=UPI000690DC6E|nr:tail fiber domain-containing protein [Siccibacter colletis]